MPSGTDYVKLYGQANAAYCQGNLEEASAIVEQMLTKFPNDLNIFLLQGHIYLGLQEFSLAQERYQTVLQLAKHSDQADLVDYAKRGLEQARISQSHCEDLDFAMEATEGIAISEPGFDPNQHFTREDWDSSDQDEDWNDDGLDWNSAVFNEDDLDEPTLGQVQPFANPFDNNLETTFQAAPPEHFSLADESGSAFDWQDDPNSPENEFPFFDEDTDPYNIPLQEDFADSGESTFVVSSDLRGNPLNMPPRTEQNAQKTFNSSHSEATLKTFQSNGKVTSSAQKENFLDELENFNEEDLDGLSGLDITDVAQSLRNFNHSGEETLSSGLEMESTSQLPSSGKETSQLRWTDINEAKEPPLSSPSLSERLLKPSVEVNAGKLTAFINAPLRTKQLIAAVAAGLTPVLVIFLVSSAAWLSTPKVQPGKETTPPKTTKTQKPPVSSTTTGATISPFSKPVLLMMLLSGLGSFGVSWLIGQIAIGHIKRTTNDLQTQFDTICEGNFNVKATIYSEDEIGHLANRFNQMARVILTTTSDAQRRASETEQAKEDLQRQVIRLLDDVEGAARGDLTVEAEVTADVLGAVADAFNLTIQNLREIVRQVKKAAKQVNKGSTDSESFARNQSSDALRMAEELAVTLNSVQMMTESIQRVAENAREAEDVARTSSITALKGGESVERTVAGILQIRETVSETARKVKRLAEASQEISKIVALISQIASRTNLLALNASIQAARAGEAGRGFAIVADEVRQLADRSAKSLKEIEQIVLQIQSETGSVMTAMEEGIQQVIDVTERSEQAKKSLEDIIQVSNRIDTLVRSITGDTVKQRENSREVAQVMQSVELTAQETSQESQRVAGSLQKLVSISRDLLNSVERFKVDSEESK